MTSRDDRGETTVFLHVGCYMTGTDRADVAHTFGWLSARESIDRKRKTVDAVCGARVKPVLVEGRVQGSDETVNMTTVWPPPVKVLARCRECMALSGKRRPHPQWRNLRFADEVSA